jgi:hypothetical protein
LLLISAIILFGLCQYNQEVLSWVILFIPLILLIVKSSYIFMTIFNISKYTPTNGNDDDDDDDDDDENTGIDINNAENIVDMHINNVDMHVNNTMQPSNMLNNTHSNMRNMEMLQSTMTNPILQDIQMNESFKSGGSHSNMNAPLTQNIPQPMSI